MAGGGIRGYDGRRPDVCTGSPAVVVVVVRGACSVSGDGLHDEHVAPPDAALAPPSLCLMSAFPDRYRWFHSSYVRPVL